MSQAASADVLGLVVVKAAWERNPLEDLLGQPDYVLAESAVRAETLPAGAQQALGVLIAHFGMDEGESISTRWPTIAEDRALLADTLAAAVRQGLTKSAAVLNGGVK